MSQWVTNFGNHKIVEKLEEAVRAFDTAPADKITGQYIARFERLQKSTRYLLERCRSIDPDLASLDFVNTAAGIVENIRSNCVAFSQNKNPAHVDNANAQVDALFNHIRINFTAALADSSRATADAAESILTKAFELNTKHKEEIEAQKTKIQSVSNSVTQIETRITEATRVIDQQKARLDQAIAEFQKQFSEAQAQRSAAFTTAANQQQEQFTAQRKEFETKFVAAGVEQKKTFDTHLAVTNKASDDHLAHLKQRKAEVDQIFGAIGSASLSGNFKQSADTDAIAANRLRIIALSLMTAMIAVGCLTYYQSIIHPELDWRVFVFRLATVIVIAIPAVYAAQESSKHRERERKSRKLEIELATIDAYLVLLPKNKQDELKEKLTERFFGRDDAVEKTDDVTKHALFEVLKGAVNNLTKSK